VCYQSRRCSLLCSQSCRRCSHRRCFLRSIPSRRSRPRRMAPCCGRRGCPTTRSWPPTNRPRRLPCPRTGTRQSRGTPWPRYCLAQRRGSTWRSFRCSGSCSSTRSSIVGTTHMRPRTRIPVLRASACPSGVGSSSHRHGKHTRQSGSSRCQHCSTIPIGAVRVFRFFFSRSPHHETLSRPIIGYEPPSAYVRLAARVRTDSTSASCEKTSYLSCFKHTANTSTASCFRTHEILCSCAGPRNVPTVPHIDRRPWKPANRQRSVTRPTASSITTETIHSIFTAPPHAPRGATNNHLNGFRAHPIP
jgi:hypothetical protein